MEDEVTASFWISFFVEAGIPPASAANYAIIFTENRIQKNMLLDLNKEYLKDMGVKVLGDIIAILKHSKLYHEKVAREKVLATDKQLSVLKATKHLNDILQKDETAKPTPIPPKKLACAEVKSGPSPPKKLKVSKTDSFKSAQDPEWVEQVEELKRKVIPPSVKLPPAKAATTTAKPVAKRTSVFDRLGESNVTSTTPEIPESSSSSSSKSLSVFNRLGGVQTTQKTITTATKQSSPIATLVAKTAAAVAAGTVKKVPSAPASSTIPVTTKMRMDIESGKQNAKQRLGVDTTFKVTELTRNLTTKTHERPSVTLRVDVGSSGTAKSNRSAPSSARTTASDVKQRLGSVAVARTNTAPNSSSVFSRLGNTRK